MSIPALIACRVRRVLAPGLLAVCLVLPLAGLASPWPCERLLIAGNSEYPPFLWQPNDDSNELKGALPQLLTEIFDGLEVTANVRHIGSWARVQKLARNGDIDLVAGAFMTEERAGYLDYVRPAITRIPTVVWFPRGREFPFRRWSDLEGKVGSTLIGNSFGQAFIDKRTIENEYLKKTLGESRKKPATTPVTRPGDSLDYFFKTIDKRGQ